MLQCVAVGCSGFNGVTELSVSLPAALLQCVAVFFGFNVCEIACLPGVCVFVCSIHVIAPKCVNMLQCVVACCSVLQS